MANSPQFSGAITTGGDPTRSSVEVQHRERVDHHPQRAARRPPALGRLLRPGHRRRAPLRQHRHHRRRDDGYVITGDLTINGITRPVDLAADFLGVDIDAYGQTRLGAEASTSIDRRDFNVTFNIPLDGGKLLIGDKIDITLAVEAVQA